MSDQRKDLLRRLRRSQRTLEEAHQDYLQAQTDSQRALGKMFDAFGDLARAVENLITVDDRAPTEEPEVQPPNSPVPPAPPTPSKAKAPKELPSESTDPDEDERQNTLPARLHSRGLTLATPDDLPSTPSPVSPPRSRESRRPTLLEQPTLKALDDTDGVPRIKKDQKIILSNDGFGVAPLLQEILTARGFRVRTESRRPELAGAADAVIFLGSLRSPNHLDDAMSVVDDAMHTVERLTTRLMQPGSAFIAAVDTAGGFGLTDFDPVVAPYGAILGLVRLVDARFPGARADLIDLNGGHLKAPQIAEILAQELLEGGGHTPVALTDEGRRTPEWVPFHPTTHPAAWLEDEPHPLIYMPGPETSLATSVERLAIAHELPVAILRRRGVPAGLADRFAASGVHTVQAPYDLNHLFQVMDFLDRIRADHGPVAALVTESFPSRSRDENANWGRARASLDEFNALLAMTINDPLHLLAVGLSPNTPPVVSSALRYFARAESLRRNELLQVRLAHLQRRTRADGDGLDADGLALTAFLSASDPMIAEVRFRQGTRGTTTS